MYPPDSVGSVNMDQTLGRPLGPPKRNNNEKLVCEELDDFLPGRDFSLSLIVRMWKSSSRVVRANDFQVSMRCLNSTGFYDAIPASSNTVESEGQLFSCTENFFKPGFWTRTRISGSMH